MNFFFGIKYKRFKSEITVPRFKNKSKVDNKYNLYQTEIYSNEWTVKKLDECVLNEYFFQIKDELIDNNKIFFLASDEELKKFDKYKIKNISDFTETSPEFRANLKTYIQNEGFSSYQSEYPIQMILKKGNILTPTSAISNKNANNNYLILRNIYYKPIQEVFYAYFVDIKNKRILEKTELKTNFSNFLKIPNTLIRPEIYIISDKFLGVPIFLSEHNGHVSFEHTHPPHEYFLGKNKFELVSKLKKEIYEIIN